MIYLLDFTVKNKLYITREFGLAITVKKHATQKIYKIIKLSRAEFNIFYLIYIF
jgi:hypothetical protein